MPSSPTPKGYSRLRLPSRDLTEASLSSPPSPPVGIVVSSEKEEEDVEGGDGGAGGGDDGVIDVPEGFKLQQYVSKVRVLTPLLVSSRPHLSTLVSPRYSRYYTLLHANTP